jgi:hypothetical protein
MEIPIPIISIGKTTATIITMSIEEEDYSFITTLLSRLLLPVPPFPPVLLESPLLLPPVFVPVPPVFDPPVLLPVPPVFEPPPVLLIGRVVPPVDPPDEFAGFVVFEPVLVLVEFLVVFVFVLLFVVVELVFPPLDGLLGAVYGLSFVHT